MSNPFLDSMGEVAKAAKTGKPDLELSTEVSKKYVTAIEDFRVTMKTQWESIVALQEYQNVGEFASANQTRTNLANARDEIKRDLEDYWNFLAKFAETVTTVSNRLISSG